MLFRSDLLIKARQRSEFGLCGSPGGVPPSVEVVGGVRLQRLMLRSELGSRRSPGETLSELKLQAGPGSHRNPDGVVLLPMEELGSRRSSGGAVLLLTMEPGSRRSPGGAATVVGGGARLP